ncbi:carboxypeptidase regulatory-like domain-containing protein [Candidatus Parcubacteria bacterium]|nr:MAG: carboxypeptidase regulatory-like domain-containing protein [Candidatus Parcubacteria bacterium]
MFRERKPAMNGKKFRTSGLTLIELLLATGLVVIIFGGIALSYSSILDSVTSTELRTAAATVIGREVEIIRNLAYEDVGIVGGAPSGVIPVHQTSTWNQVEFLLTTVIRNIDDPYDGTLTGSPADTAPADYKVVEIEASCPTCNRFIPLRFTTTVAPKDLESATAQGSLFVNVYDANGSPMPGATVSVVNASVTPSISLTDTTNNQGQLQLIGIPTSTQRYAVTVSRSGYSSDTTYLPGAPQNPNPTKPHATVAQGTLTQASFVIDQVSTVNVRTSDAVCAALPDKNFSLQGSKLIGTNPDVYKFSTSSATDSSGMKTFANMEWDAYAATLNEASYDIVGTIPLSPFVVNPDTVLDFRFVLKLAEPKSFLVTIKDSGTGGTITGATLVLSKSGFSETRLTGRSSVEHTDWSGASHSSQDGNVAVGSPAGSMRLVGPPYPTSTEAWLISNTIDVGSSSSTFYAIHWSPASQPALTSARFQVASNNDQATWNFIGPDGTSNTYYSISGATTAVQHNGNRYLRYKTYLSTQDENLTPEIQDVSIEFNSVCVPPSQILFDNLVVDTYTLDVSAPGYTSYSTSTSIVGDWQQAEILLDPS